MSGIRTQYEFVLPRGYLDESGVLHKRGVMRLATARDELQPLRDPTVTGPDDPRLTILVLARVVQTLGSMELVTPHEIEGLFAADLAYLQDFYGVINFGTPEEIDALLAAQEEQDRAQKAVGAPAASGAPEPQPGPAENAAPEPSGEPAETRPPARRSSIEEVSSAGR
ncbi:MAG TPA: hypothetical protein VKU88_07255 [Acidimicrobiales bacterium]|nr:hypothetical protein [Acidimicrobiales bacterium]